LTGKTLSSASILKNVSFVAVLLRKKLTALTTNFTENELDFAIVVVKAMNQLQTP